jgi:hypothetical protein
MSLEITKETAKKLYPESQRWFQERLEEAFGKDCFKRKSFDSIKTFEDACEELEIDPTTVVNSTDQPDEAAYKKLKIIIRAINQGWIPDRDDTKQRKCWPFFNLANAGFVTSYVNYAPSLAYANFGFRLCFESEEKANYAGRQFLKLYKEFLAI